MNVNGEGCYLDRADAGRTLAMHLRALDVGENPLILALPRGGVPVAFEIAMALAAPLDIFPVRKLGLPSEPEVAMGAIALGGIKILDSDLIAQAGLSQEAVAVVIERETKKLRRREKDLNLKNLSHEVSLHPVIVVDDGLATGFTMLAAITALRTMGCPRITAVVPVGNRSRCEEIARKVDLFLCPLQPDRFRAVGSWYENFSATTDDEVKKLLEMARRAHRSRKDTAAQTGEK